MKNKKIEIHYQENHFDQMDNSALKQLISETIAFAKNAYAPYSQFHVSAGLILENGTILKGSNVENASYPVSICAERTLIGHTISNYPDQKITDLVVYVDKKLGKPVPPCGLCRQTLVEVEDRQQKPIRLHMVAKEGDIIQLENCRSLLPWSFDGTFLRE